MLSTEQALAILNMQNKMNCRVNPSWMQAGYPFMCAAMVEAVEALEHHGWKWWKHQECDLPQLRMEMVDIIHFVASKLILESQGDLNKAAKRLSEIEFFHSIVEFDSLMYNLSELDTARLLRLLTGLSAADRVSISVIDAILQRIEMSWDSLFDEYVGKNVLNFFRQDHGYKEGVYIKTWAGREDNEHLVEIMGNIDPSTPDYQDALYRALADRYAKVA